MMEKRCRACSIIKPLDEFYVQAAGRFGKTSRCIPCTRAEHSAYRERVRPATVKEARARKQSLFSRGLKACSKCESVKPFEELFRHGNGRMFPECKTCKLEAHKAWKADNKQHMFGYVREYKARPAVSNKTKEMRLKLRAASPRMVMQTTLAHGLKRRQTENPATIEDLMQKWHANGGRCAVSGIQMTWNKGKVLPTSVSLDRIDPDGGYSADNLRLICHAVNAFRGRMSDTEMLAMAKAIVAHKEPVASDAVAGYLSLAA